MGLLCGYYWFFIGFLLVFYWFFIGFLLVFYWFFTGFLPECDEGYHCFYGKSFG
jgi:hypothetical protein